MSKLLIVTATKSSNYDEFANRPLAKSLNYHYEKNGVDFNIVSNNQEGLPSVYNKILKDPKNINKTVLFVHDDVELNDVFLKDKLLSSPYTITGVAGAKTFNKNVEKFAWHLATERKDMVGEAAHTQNGRVWTSVFGPTPSRALIIDGLFISCKVKKLVEAEVFFDEDFSFHHYDMSFCLRANQNKKTVGVLPIHLIHHGLGDSMLTSEWEVSNIKFKEKYCK